MKIFLTLVFVFSLVGCTESNTKPSAAAKPSDGRVFWFTPERVVYASEQSLWLQACAYELMSHSRGTVTGDAIFIPKADPAEEIFQKCDSVKPLSSDKVSIYKKWLKERVSEIQSITTGTTRKKVNQILRQNGGFSSLDAAIYSHIECDVLKVRIEFELVSDKHAGFPFNENDKVKAASMPYLGFFIYD
jgi:hypothetical protein